MDIAIGSDVVLDVTRRCRAERLARNWTQQDLADRAGCSRKTISDLERGHAPSFAIMADVITALGHGESLREVVPAPTPSPMAALEAQASQRQRARPTTKPSPPAAWTWGDEGEDEA